MDNLATSPMDSLPSGVQSPTQMPVNYRRDRRRGSIFMRKNISDAIVGGLSDSLPPSNPQQLKSLNLLAQTTRKQQQQQQDKGSGCSNNNNSLLKNKHTVVHSSSHILSGSPNNIANMSHYTTTNMSRSGSHVQLQQPYSKNNIFGRLGVVKSSYIKSVDLTT